MAQFSWIWQKKPFQYVVTPDDKLELARAVQHEGPPQAAVLWTLLQRFAMLYARGDYKSLAVFVRAYAQPINPKWFPDGELFKARYQELLNAGKKAEAAAEKRRADLRPAKAKVTWEQISPSVRHLVENVLSGNRPISRAPGALHYWASRATPTMKPAEAKNFNASRRPELKLLDIGGGFGAGVNVFFSSADSVHLRNLRFGSGSGGAIGGALVALILGYALYRYYGG